MIFEEKRHLHDRLEWKWREKYPGSERNSPERPPENYQKPPKNYPPIAFGSKSVGFYPVVSEKMP